MKMHLKWNEAMKFQASSDNNLVLMDAKTPIGTGSAMTPKELVAAGLCGCTAMDVAALLKKHKQTFNTLEVDAEILMSSSGQPVVFSSAVLTFKVTGDVSKEVLLESVKLSQTKYCGVSAMLSKAFPITYTVELNGESIGSGRAEF